MRSTLKLRAPLSLLVLLACLWPAPAQAQIAAPPSARKRALVDRIVAVVNDSVILYSDLAVRVAPLSREIRGISDAEEQRRRLAKLEAQVLESLVNEELISQAAGAANLEVTAKQVSMAIEDTKTRNNLDDEEFREALRSQGETLASYKASTRKQILRIKAINVLVRPRVNISEDDIRAQYDAANRRQAGVSRVNLQHILIAAPDDANDADKAAAKKKAALVIEKSRSGAPFGELAATYSDDGQTKSSGGDLGWIERNSLPTEWETVVFAMSKGEVRGPIQSPRGFHVFHVADVERGEQKPLEEMKDQIHNELFRVELDRETLLWIDELKKKAHVQTRL